MEENKVIFKKAKLTAEQIEEINYLLDVLVKLDCNINHNLKIIDEEMKKINIEDRRYIGKILMRKFGLENKQCHQRDFVSPKDCYWYFKGQEDGMMKLFNVIKDRLWKKYGYSYKMGVGFYNPYEQDSLIKNDDKGKLGHDKKGE